MKIPKRLETERLSTGSHPQEKSESQDADLNRIFDHYKVGLEARRLLKAEGRLELARSQELLKRYLPPPPAVILDVGGGSGIYACWLARLGYAVHLVDPVALHVDQARQSSDNQPDYPLASARIGDARQLDFEDNFADGLLLFGPLYHLTEQSDRLLALSEAKRVLRPGGVLLAVGISRFASTLAGFVKGHIDDPEFVRIARQDLQDGQHRNPSQHPSYFTTAYFHQPGELEVEMEEAGLHHEVTVAVEGPFWMLHDIGDQWHDPDRREKLLAAVQAIEAEPSLMGASSHMMAMSHNFT